MSTEPKNPIFTNMPADGSPREKDGDSVLSQARLSHHRRRRLIYIFVYMNGEINHSTAAAGAAAQRCHRLRNGFMYMVAGLIAVYAVILFAFVYKKSDHEE